MQTKRLLKITLAGIIMINFSLHAQLYTPSGIIQGASGSSNVGIGTATPKAKLEVAGNSSVYSDFKSYSGITVGNFLPNGKEPTLNITENTSGTMIPATGGQITYRGGLSFGRGGPGIYSVNPNPAGSSYYGDLYFQTTYWNGSNYNNADRMVIKMDGNVGIGTASPDRQVVVGGTGQIGLYGKNSGVVFNNSKTWDISASSTGLFFNETGIRTPLVLTPGGNVGIGTVSPDAKLAVKGLIHAQEVKVDLLGAMVPDYVFAKGYKLESLKEVEEYINKHHHLPEIPSAAAVEKNGVQLGEMNMALLKKIEELTLYAIEQHKKIENLEKQNEVLTKITERLSTLEKQIGKK